MGKEGLGSGKEGLGSGKEGLGSGKEGLGSVDLELIQEIIQELCDIC